MRNIPDVDPLEEARERLRAAVARSSVRAVAREASMDHTRLAAFVAPDSTVRPRGDMLARVLAFGSPQPAAPSPSPADPADAPTYWQGRAEGIRTLVDLIARTSTAALRDLDGLLASGVLRESAVSAALRPPESDVGTPAGDAAEQELAARLHAQGVPVPPHLRPPASTAPAAPRSSGGASG